MCLSASTTLCRFFKWSSAFHMHRGTKYTNISNIKKTQTRVQNSKVLIFLLLFKVYFYICYSKMNTTTMIPEPDLCIVCDLCILKSVYQTWNMTYVFCRVIIKHDMQPTYFAEWLLNMICDLCILKSNYQTWNVTYVFCRVTIKHDIQPMYFEEWLLIMICDLCMLQSDH